LLLEFVKIDKTNPKIPALTKKLLFCLFWGWTHRLFPIRTGPVRRSGEIRVYRAGEWCRYRADVLRCKILFAWVQGFRSAGYPASWPV